MTKKLAFTAIVIGMLGMSLNSIAQNVSNINAVNLEENIVRVSYDLQGEVPGQLFKVELFSSVNDFSLPLEFVEGYVGEDIEAGSNKFIDWDIGKELIAFDGELTFEIRAELTFTPISVSFPARRSITRGRAHSINWKGSKADENVDIVLYQDGRKVKTIAKTVNDGEYQWMVPFTTRPGGGYSIRISSTSSTQSDSGGEFSIRRKIPLLAKIIPMAAVVPVVISIADGGGPEGPSILPAPPNTPD